MLPLLWYNRYAMKEETYQAIVDEIDTLDLKWLGDNTLTLEEKEKCRIQFNKDWERIIEKNGVSVKEFEDELDKRCFKENAGT